jgi:hypothetical protein
VNRWLLSLHRKNGARVKAYLDALARCATVNRTLSSLDDVYGQHRLFATFGRPTRLGVAYLLPSLHGLLRLSHRDNRFLSQRFFILFFIWLDGVPGGAPGERHRL